VGRLISTPHLRKSGIILTFDRTKRKRAIHIEKAA
jgi:hypothetical protein